VTQTVASVYDRVLVGIGASLVAGLLVGVIGPVAPRVGLFAGALLATPLVYVALFRNPPRPAASRRRKAAALLWHLVLGAGFALFVW
jgi:hypothetical protein